MAEFDLSRKSRPVVIVPYQIRWPDEFRSIAVRIRQVVGPYVVRIDHIGSTAVPGLAAKDVLDIQVTIDSFDRMQNLTTGLRSAGFRQGKEFVHDEFRSMAASSTELRKLYMREPDGERRMHIHIRENGRFNQRYALLFRDYLRSSEAVRVEYEVAKRRAAQLFPECIDGYLFLKDPVFHIIYEAADLWAQLVGWVPDDRFS